jgi:alpha-beta hydrolase superfamily lysophospholipase
MLSETQLRTTDGLALYAWTRQPAGRAQGVIAHVHGLGEHSRRYDHLTGYRAEHAHAAAGFDLRGHGRSAGPRGHTPAYERLLEDIAVFLDAVAAALPGLPITLYGHSMGGNLVLNYAIRRQPPLSSVIASATYLRLAFEPPAWKVKLAQWMRRIAPTMTQRTGLDVSALSRDPEVVRNYQSDPLVHDKITAALFSEVHAAGEAVVGQASALTVPALLMHGSADRITSPVGSAAFVDAAGGRAQLEVWDGFFHEIHNEPGWQRVAATALQWTQATERR